jgi:CheY-like chemotaxis protein
MVEDVRGYLSEGMTDHLAKPFTPDRLFDVAARVTRIAGDTGLRGAGAARA